MKKNAEEYNQIFVNSFLKKLQLDGADFEYWHTPNGGSRNKAEASKLKLMGALPGVPDLILIAKGILVFIEFKLSNGKLSDAQKLFISKARRYGFDVFDIYGDTPQGYIEAVGKIMLDVFGIDQNSISKCSTSALGAAALKS